MHCCAFRNTRAFVKVISRTPCYGFLRTMAMSASATPKTSFSLEAYCTRIGLEPVGVDVPRDVALLTTVMAAHSRAISFENIDVVLRSAVSVQNDEVYNKMVVNARGGYCFEHNALLALALNALGYRAEPILCRVRWNKQAQEQTTFTHLALRVHTPVVVSADTHREGASAGKPGVYLADVGFAGTNSIAPVDLDQSLQEGEGQPQILPEGRFRVKSDASTGYSTLSWEIGSEWRDLYAWRTSEVASEPDIIMSNFYSYAYPSARFTNQFFLARVIGNARHHILNDVYGVRSSLNGATATEQVRIADKPALLRLLRDTFGVRLDPTAAEKTAEAWARSYSGRTL